MPFNLGFGEILVVLLVAVIVFGRRLPDVARRVGRGVSEFKRGLGDELSTLDIRDELRAPVDWKPPIPRVEKPAPDEKKPDPEAEAEQEPEDS